MHERGEAKKVSKLSSVATNNTSDVATGEENGAEIQPFSFAEASAFCVSCHNSPTSLSAWKTAGTEQSWQERLGQISSAVETNTMPPEPLNENDKARFMKFLESLNGGNALAEPAALIQPLDSCTGSELLPARLWRLSESQLKNTINDLFGSVAATHVPVLGEQGVGQAFPSNDISLVVSSAMQIDFLSASERISDIIVKAQGPVKACTTVVTAPASSTCITDVITSLGAKIWRRPLSSEEVAAAKEIAVQLIAAGATRAQGIRASIEAMLQSPYFWYRSEVGEQAGAPAGQRKLTAFEVASFLSYTIWDGPPDEILTATAASGGLLTQQVLEEQIARMIANEKSARGLSAFLNEWSGFSGVLTRPKDEVYGAALSTNVRRALHQETQDFIKKHGFESNATVAEFFSTNKSYLNSDLNAFYDISIPVGTPGPGNAVTEYSHDPNKRAGFFTLPSFISSHSSEGTTTPSHRGYFLVSEVLCKPLVKPEDIEPIDAVDSEENTANLAQMTTRQIFQDLHSRDPACAACHRVLDPAGFSFENFDPIGRFRTTEKGGLPIDATGTLSGIGEVNVGYTGAPEMFRKLSQTQRFHDCAVTKFAKNIFGSVPAEKTTCEVSRLNQGFISNEKRMLGLLKALSKLNSVYFRKAPE